MSKTYDQIINKGALRNYEAFEAIWHTRAFRQFCEQNKSRVKEDLESRLQALSQKSAKDREVYEQAWIELPFDEVLAEALRSAFVSTFAGKQVMGRLKGLDVHEGAIGYDKELLAGKYLRMHIDLTKPKILIMAWFKHIIDKEHPKVERLPTPPRGAAIRDPDKIDTMFRAYDLVEEHLSRGENIHQSVLKATLQLYTKVRQPRLKTPVEDKRYQTVLRLHERAKKIINEAEPKENEKDL